MVELFTTIFTTNVELMTVKDWVGTFITVLVFVLMCFTYFWVFRPMNKLKIEVHRHHLLEHDKDEPM